MTSDEFAALQRKVEQLKADRDRSIGARGEMLKRLKENKLKSLEEALAKLKELKNRKAKLDRLIEQELSQLQKDHPDLLED